MTTTPVASPKIGLVKSRIALVFAVLWIFGLGSTSAIFLSVSEIRRAKREGKKASMVNYIALALGIAGALVTFIWYLVITQL